MWEVFKLASGTINRLRMRVGAMHTSAIMSELLNVLLVCFSDFSQFFSFSLRSLN